MKNAEIEMKDSIVLIAFGIVGIFLALAPSELKGAFGSDLPPAANALPIALVSAYSSIKVARIRAEADKTRHPVPHQESWLDTLLWAMLIFIMLVIAIMLGVLASEAFL